MSIWDTVKDIAGYTPPGLIYRGGKWVYDTVKKGAKDTFSTDKMSPYQPDPNAFEYGYSPEESHAVPGTKQKVTLPDGTTFYVPWSQQREVTRPATTYRDELDRQQVAKDAAAQNAMRQATIADQYGQRETGYYDRAGSILNNDQYASRGMQQSAYDRMMAMANQGPGPSAALAQLKMGQDAAMQQSLALARSGRGVGASSAATRNAIFQNSGLNAQTNQQAAVLRAQEEAAWRQQQANLYQGAGALGTNVRAGDVTAAQTFGQMAGTQGTLRGQSEDRAQGYEQLGMQDEILRQQILQQQQQAQQSYQQLVSANNMAAQGANINADIAQDTSNKALIGSAFSAIGGAAAKSDRNAKTNIQPLTEDAAEDMVRRAPGYSYEYKDPADGTGRYVGPMAQDLEKSTAGSALVKRSPDGQRVVDTGHLALANTAALHAQQRQLDDLMAKIDRMSGGRR